MKIIEWFLELFRRKEYYQIDYQELNKLSIAFKEINDADLEKIEITIAQFKNADSIADDKSNMFEKTARKFLNTKELVEAIKQTVLEDYRKTYFEAIEKKWNFNYFVTDYEPVSKNSLFVCNRLFSLVENGHGEVMYPLLAVRKYHGAFYFWSFLEKYEGFM